MNLLIHSQMGFPFHPSHRVHGTPAMHRLRVAARKESFIRHPIWIRILAKALIALLWPIGAGYLAIRHGFDYRAKLLKVLDAWWLAVSRNVPPVEYFEYRLWEAARRERLDDYLYWTENGLALAVLNKSAGLLPGSTPVSDKQLFFRFCLEHELPTPRIIGTWESGSPGQQGALPRCDYWLKPAESKGGLGAERWDWSNEGYRRHREMLTVAQMINHVADHSRVHQKSLVQQVVHSHANHAQLIGDAPLCARVITGRHRTGAVEIVDALAMWPRRGSETTQGGHIAMIEVATGCLRAEFGASNNAAERQMEGQLLPDWHLALKHVRKGHAVLSQYAFLGWDIAFGQDGPVLLETNAGWSSIHFQVVPDRPIADTAFASIAAEYV